MAKNSSIEWTDHTFNPWWGCSKVSPGCNNCYAEKWAQRLGLKVWGQHQSRRFFGDKHWHEPLQWNAAAKREGRRKRVFCASMADVFENRAELNAWRDRLWSLLLETTWLDWLLLTKRPQNIENMIPWGPTWPSNLWLGTTVEDQARAIERLPFLLRHNARVRFLSCEPLLGAVDLSHWVNAMPNNVQHSVDWVIAGGESGLNARPMLPSWARSLRDQCRRSKIPFHFKQWGHWSPTQKQMTSNTVRGFWDDVRGEEVLMEAKGKKESGRNLDDTTWDQLPEPETA